MRHYKITESFRDELNRYLDTEYIKENDVGRELYHLQHYNRLARVSPTKAKLLMATLFPEGLGDEMYLASHRKEIIGLAGKLQIKKWPAPVGNWTDFMIRKESAGAVAPSNKSDEDIFEGNIVRFR